MLQIVQFLQLNCQPWTECSEEEEEQEEEHTSIKSFDVPLTLARDLQLFWIEKGEEKAAEDNILQDAKPKTL